MPTLRQNVSSRRHPRENGDPEAMAGHIPPLFKGRVWVGSGGMHHQQSEQEKPFAVSAVEPREHLFSLRYQPFRIVQREPHSRKNRPSTFLH